MLAGFSALADMFTGQRAAPRVADNGPSLFCGMLKGASSSESKFCPVLSEYFAHGPEGPRFLLLMILE